MHNVKTNNNSFPATNDLPFQIANWYIDPPGNEIRLNNQCRKLEPKVMAVLVCLAQQGGNMVSREQLEAEVWAGRVVGYDSLSNAIIKLRKAFGDSSRQPNIIETIPRKGYRLIAEIKPISPPSPATSPDQHSPPPINSLTNTQQAAEKKTYNCFFSFYYTHYRNHIFHHTGTGYRSN